MAVIIRRATRDDLEALLDLRDAVAAEGVWIGIAGLGIQVADGHRGQGIGAALVAEAIEWARGAGVHKVELECWPWNGRARALYERFGFVEEGYRRRQYRRKDGSLWDSIVMGLVLDHDAPGHAERATEPPI